MPSTFTKNLGIELPATGEQANTWGITVNRNMDTLDTATNGNASIQLTTSPYDLSIANGADSPLAANPVIAWTGPQTGQVTVRIDWQSARQHLYFMSNQTGGGYGISFAQSPANSFVLQAGYDAIVYANGGGNNATVTQFLANPQFASLLTTGNAQVGGNLQLGAVATLTGDAQGNVKLTGGLGVGNPTAIPDPLTVTGIGNGGQMRLVQAGNYGVIFRNDGSSLSIMFTAAGDPYGSAVAPIPLQIDLPTRAVGLGGANAIPGFGLNTTGMHATTITCDGLINGGGGLNISGPRSYFRHAEASNLAFEYNSGVPMTWIGTNASGQFQISNVNGFSMMVVDQSGNATLGGGLHIAAGGLQFADGTVQTTAAVATNNFPGNITVNGVINGPSAAFGSPVLYCPPFTGSNPSGPVNSVMFSYNPGNPGFVTIWVIKSDGSKWIADVNLAGPM